MNFILIFLYIQSFIVDGSINYCGAKMCAHTNAHTFCRYPPGPGLSCMGYIELKLSQDDKARILARLNRRRSEVARGTRGLPPAGDMLKLRWIEELAREAQRWADQCNLPNTPEEHDICRDLYSISVGQCVASVVGEAPGLRPETMIDMWYMQSMKYRGNLTTYLPPESTSQYYSDFAQIIWSRAYMVGCGRSKFMIHWRDRLRSVDRLVCNFAPRGPTPLRALWSPAQPATTCPPRSRPDEDLPALCTFQHYMDESYDEDNIMTLEEHLLLNTILTIERNVSLNNIGSLDEIYLTKLAIATIDNYILATPYSFVQKRDVDQKIGVETSIEIEEVNNLNNSNSKLTYDISNKPYKRKGTFVGRPKSYNLEDLSDESEHEKNIDIESEEMRTDEKYIYEDYQTDIHSDITTSVISSLTVNLTISGPNLTYNRADIYGMKNDKIDTSDTFIRNEEDKIMISETTVMNTEVMDLYINDVVASLNLSHITNKTSIDENIIEEYLSNPETVRQLQESLNRMEYKIAGSASASGKVRRELRKVKDEGQQLESNLQIKNKLSAEAERNKSIERGPMLNMVLKYMPYLKPYEKSIIGDTNFNGTNKISLSVLSLCYALVLFIEIF